MVIFGEPEERAADCFSLALAECYPLSEEDQKEEVAYFYAINDPSQKRDLYDCRHGLGVMPNNNSLQDTMKIIYTVIKACCEKFGEDPYEMTTGILLASEKAVNENAE